MAPAVIIVSGGDDVVLTPEAFGATIIIKNCECPCITLPEEDEGAASQTIRFIVTEPCCSVFLTCSGRMVGNLVIKSYAGITGIASDASSKNLVIHEAAIGSSWTATLVSEGMWAIGGFVETEKPQMTDFS